MSVDVLLAAVGDAEPTLAAALESAAGIRLARRCADLAELVACARTGLGRVAVVSCDLHQLDRDAVRTVRTAGVAVVLLADDNDRAAYARRMGADRVLVGPGAPDAPNVLAAVRELADGPPGDAGVLTPPFMTGPSVATSGVDLLVSDPGDGLAAAAAGAGPAAGRAVDGVGDRVGDRAGDRAADPDRPGEGRIVAVWGPVGAPGRTSVAVSLAAELAEAGRSTLLVDADTYGPSIAQHLALLDEAAGLAAAVRSAAQGRLSTAQLGSLAPQVTAGLRVLTGLVRVSRWPELRPAALQAVWQQARQLCEGVVVDCGFCLERDEELSYDTPVARRNAATLSALAAADVVVAVGSGDPVGLQRLVRGLAELTEVLGPVSPVVVVTKVRASAVGSSPQRRIEDALERYAGVTDVWCIPDDRATLDQALLVGRTLVEAAPTSAVRRAYQQLAARLPAVRPPVLAATGTARPPFTAGT